MKKLGELDERLHKSHNKHAEKFCVSVFSIRKTTREKCWQCLNLAKS